MPSRTSDVGMVGPRDSDHLVHLIDIPPLPARPYSSQRREDSPVPNAALRAQRSKDSLQSAQYSDRYGKDRQGRCDGSVSSDGWNTPGTDRPRPRSYVIDTGTPPPIPAAHLHTPISSRHSSERPTPLTQMNSTPSSKKRKPALHLDLNSHPAVSSPLSHLTASRGFVNDIDTSMGPAYSVSSTTTPSPSALDWPDIIARDHFHRHREPVREPNKIFVVKNPNFIFPSITREPNPAGSPSIMSPGAAFEERVDPESTPTTTRSRIRSLSTSLRSLLHAYPSPSSHTQAHNTDSETQPRPSISGPSLYTFAPFRPEWSITQTEVYRNASPIPNPLIEHPDLEKGYRRPQEWGERSPDLVEAEVISGQMRTIERLRRERELQRERAWERLKERERSQKGKEIAADDLDDDDEEWEEDEEDTRDLEGVHAERPASSVDVENWPLERSASERRRASL